MKKITYLLAGALSISLASAQNMSDAIRLSDTEYIGTARASGMGGAMNGLGIDPQSVHINPANLANLKNNYFSFTPYFGFNSSFGNNYSFINTKSQFSIGNIYLSFGSSEKTKFYMSLNRTNDYQNYLTHNYSGSLLDTWTNQANGLGFPSSDQLRNNYPFDSYLAYQTYLINPDSANGTYTPVSGDVANQNYSLEEKGNQYTTSFGSATKINDFLSVGWGLNMKTYSYKSTKSYAESNNDASSDMSYFNVEETERSTGTGFSLKLGAVIKPTKKLRHSLSYETGSFYWMSDNWSGKINSYFDDANYEYEMNGSFNYYAITPARYSIGNGFVLSKNLAFNLDYQYVDFRSTKFISQSSAYDLGSRNDLINDELNGVHHVNFGFESRINNAYFRGGYGVNTAVMKDESKTSKNNYGFGVGFNHANSRFDLGFVNIISHGLIDTPAAAGSTEETARKINEMKLLATWTFKF